MTNFIISFEGDSRCEDEGICAISHNQFTLYKKTHHKKNISDVPKAQCHTSPEVNLWEHRLYMYWSFHNVPL